MPRPAQTDPFVPALRYSALTAVYDPLVHWTLREAIFKPTLVQQAQIEPGKRVLDLGCDTGTLTLLAQQLHPDAEVVGIDGDPQVLRIARAKAAHRSVQLQLDQGMTYALPYPDNSFDRVLSSLVLHHLTHDAKLRTLREVARVLRAGGELHLADWGQPQNPALRAGFLLVQLLDSFRTTQEHVQGSLPDLIATAGLTEVRERAAYATIFGTLRMYSARTPR